MRLLDGDKEEPLYNVQLYFTENEASQLCTALQRLLKNPEADDHDHVFSESGDREISFSLITPTKLAELHKYTLAEQKMFEE